MFLPTAPTSERIVSSTSLRSLRPLPSLVRRITSHRRGGVEDGKVVVVDEICGDTSVPEEKRLRCTGAFVNTLLQVGDSDSIEYKHALIPDY